MSRENPGYVDHRGCRTRGSGFSQGPPRTASNQRFKIWCALPIRDRWKSTEDRFQERIAAREEIAFDSDDKDALDRIKGTLKVYGGNSLLEIIKTSELVGDMILLMATAATNSRAPAKKSAPTSNKSAELRRRRRQAP